MIKFGVARKYHRNLVPYLEVLKSNSISLYEMGFAFSIPPELPKEVLEFAKRNNIILTGHLPFYINFGNKNQVNKSIEYLKRGFVIADKLDTISVFHLGFYMKRNFKEIKKDILRGFKEVLALNLKKGYLGIETTGKQTAIGKYDEVKDLIKEINNPRVIPIIDIAHIYARSNGLFPSKREDFQKILDNLDKLSIKKLYFHAGGIEYEKGNERKHTTIKKCEPPLAFLLDELERRGQDAFVIIESPTSIEDVKWIRENKNIFLDYTKTQLLKNKKQNLLQEFF
jgi:deoxyribonuclease-4